MCQPMPESSVTFILSLVSATLVSLFEGESIGLLEDEEGLLLAKETIDILGLRMPDIKPAALLDTQRDRVER